MPDVEINTKGLDAIIKSLKGKLPSVKVGVLGDKNSRSGTKNGNATIGSFHEFGTETLPVRSFLRVPITDNLQTYLEKAGAFNKNVLAEVIRSGSIKIWLEKVGAIGVNIVQDAFNTGGFGEWPPSNMTHKKVHMTLVETQQLRNSITYEVK